LLEKEASMRKQVFLGGLLGGVALLAWIIVSMGILNLTDDRQKPLMYDLGIHDLLKQRITEPGIYYLPAVEGDNGEPLVESNEPFFVVMYPGRTTDEVGVQLIYGLICIFIAALIAAWLLSVSSDWVLAKYFRRVLFVTALGLLLAIAGDIVNEKPVMSIFLSSANLVIGWALVGIVIAWRVKGGTRQHETAAA
jgi:hypothetical protein